MLSVLRVRRWIAGTLLLSILTATISQAFASHTPDEHDIQPVAIPHDESAHQLSAASPVTAAHPIHCLLCHWVRAFKPSRSLAAHDGPHLGPSAAVPFVALPARTTLVAAQLTLRSPPSTLFVL